MNLVEHMLTLLGEEGVEVAKECSKANRFGIDDVNFLQPKGPSNRQRLVNELNDLYAVVEMCEAFGILPADWESLDKKTRKKMKVMDMLSYAKKTGALQERKGKIS